MVPPAGWVGPRPGRYAGRPGTRSLHGHVRRVAGDPEPEGERGVTGDPVAAELGAPAEVTGAGEQGPAEVELGRLPQPQRLRDVTPGPHQGRGQRPHVL